MPYLLISFGKNGPIHKRMDGDSETPWWWEIIKCQSTVLIWVVIMSCRQDEECFSGSTSYLTGYINITLPPLEVGRRRCRRRCLRAATALFFAALRKNATGSYRSPNTLGKCGEGRSLLHGIFWPRSGCGARGPQEAGQ